MGISARLGLSFAAVAALAIVSNLVAEYGTFIVTTTSSFVLGANATNSKLGIVSRVSPLPRLDFAVLLDALTGFERATEAQLQLPSVQHSADFTNTAGRVDQLTQELLVRAPADQAAAIQAISARWHALRRSAAFLVQSTEIRRVRFVDYSGHLESIDSLLKSAFDHNWKIFGRVLARQSLLTLSAELDEMRSRAVRSAPITASGSIAVTRVAESEAKFAVTLEHHRAEFERSQGAEWLQQVQEHFAGAVSARTELVANELRLATARGSFDDHSAAMISLVRPLSAPMPPPAVAPPSNDAALTLGHGYPPLGFLNAVPVDQSRTETTALLPGLTVRLSVATVSLAMVLLLLAVSVATVRSIVRPIKQFMSTTRRLSRGDSRARFQRGGIAELDSLAISLNEMADTLEKTQSATRDYQGALEVRIDERTRQLQHLAEHDSLTGLPNRRHLLKHLTNVLAAEPKPDRVVMFFLDLDNFKTINDSMGHPFGDRVLQGIAHRLRTLTAPDGFAARLGGDEFMAVYTPCDSTDRATRYGEQLVAAFQKPLLIDNRELLVSVSVGGSLYPEHAASADALLRAADTALFRAKSLGRNQFSLFSHELLERAATQFDIEQGLRRAVERNEFELVFQPEVDFQTHQTELVEALLRWRLPDRRHISPAQFLAVAKESGLNARISDWVLRSAIEWVAKWRAGSWPAARVAINVSASQLLGTRLIDQMQELLETHRVPPQCIEIELTEDILQTGPSTLATLRELRKLNLSIALDDFGTGFSSLASLQQLPLTRVKLDQSLVASIDIDARSAAIAGAIIRLCREVGLAVTAEGIERFRQLELLVEHGPICFQGYLISHPVAADELPAALSALPEQLRKLSARFSRSSHLELRKLGTTDDNDPLLLDFHASESA